MSGILSDRATRLQLLKEHVTALNKQYLDWVQKQLDSKPDKIWDVQDYQRHSSKIRMEFADVIADPDDGLNGGSPKATEAYQPQLSLMPYCNTKIIHFIRHGEGFHNVGVSGVDSHLTSKGWAQAEALGKHIFSQAPSRNVQLVIVSPLMRALETAAGVFGLLDENLNSNVGSVQMLMSAQTEEFNVRTSHQALVSRPGIAFVANELARERLGPSPCDSRRPISVSSSHFPTIDFSLVESDVDNVWEAGKCEPESSVARRGRRLLKYLMARPETNIAVVTHSALLWFTLLGHGNECGKSVREKVQRWYENCEMRSLVLCDGGGGGAPDVTWFPGGHAYNEPQKELLSS